jgi:hypothetical protein
MPLDHDHLCEQYITRLQTQLSQLRNLAKQSTMHTSFLSAAVVSFLAISVSAAPTKSQSQSTVQPAHLPGSPHGPLLHHSGTSSSAGTSESSTPSPQDLETRHASRLNEDVMKNLIVEIKRDDTTSQDQSQGNKQQQEDDGENHATYMLGSPISLPARGSQGGRNVA